MIPGPTCSHAAAPVILCLAAFAAACGSEPEADLSWPGWRGPDGSGVVDTAPLPVGWGPESPNLRWAVEVPGRGNSSPVAAGGRVFLTSALPPLTKSEGGGLRRVAMAFDLESGYPLWRTEVATLPKGGVHRLNTYAAPTPVTDGQRVFVYFGSLIAALDARTGDVLWKVELEDGYFDSSRYGASTSLVLAGGAVIVAQDQEAWNLDGGWMAALATDTGGELWRVSWDDTCCSYSTPLVVDRGAGEEIIFVHSRRVASYAAATGDELWRQEVPIAQMVATPVLDGDLLGVAGGAHNVRHTRFYALRGSGRDTSAELLWETGRFAPETSSPVLFDGRFFSLTDKGVLTCYEARTGRLLWKIRIGAGHRAALLAGDGKVYALAATGATTVVRAADEPEILAVNEFDDPSNNASPAVAGGCLLIRTRSRLHCIEAEPGTAPAAAS